MNSQLEPILYKIASKTLEQLAFLFSSPEEVNCCPNYDKVLVASISFTGHFSGTVRMMIYSEVLDELTENMLGVDDAAELTLDQKHDALKETINIVCGNLLPLIGGKRSLFSIGSPCLILDNDAKKKAVKNCNEHPFSAVARLSIDDKLCSFFLLLDDDVKLDISL
jgi:CheY-specific phosphatase CheX